MPFPKYKLIRYSLRKYLFTDFKSIYIISIQHILFQACFSYLAGTLNPFHDNKEDNCPG